MNAMFLHISGLCLEWTQLHQFRIQALLLQEQRFRLRHGLMVVAQVPPLWGTREGPQDKEKRLSALLVLVLLVQTYDSHLEMVLAPGLVETLTGGMVRPVEEASLATPGPAASCR